MTRSPLPKRAATILLTMVLISFVAGQAPAEARRNRIRQRDRTTVIVHKSFPLHRRFPAVVIHPMHSRVAFVTPVRYFPAVVWKMPVVAMPARERVVWEDSETFTIDDGWSEISLGVNDRGTALLLHVDGDARFDFAEIVFGSGDVQVVDFDNRLVRTGTFNLLDFADGRAVSYVRLLGKAESETAIVSLRMVK